MKTITYVYTHIYVRTHTHICAHTYIHTQGYTDTHTHLYTDTDRQTDRHTHDEWSTWNALLSPEIVVLRFGMDSTYVLRCMGEPSICRNFEECTPAKIFCAATLEGVAVSLLVTVGVAAELDTEDFTSADLVDGTSYKTERKDYTFILSNIQQESLYIQQNILYH